MRKILAIATLAVLVGCTESLIDLRDDEGSAAIPGPAFPWDPIDPSDDFDRDGVPDGLDNCELDANPDQANEDNDPTGDVCDLCPPFAGGGDTDGDGVGNLCDPRPTLGGDAIAAFVGFHSGLPLGWTVSGMFTTSSGSGKASAPANQGAILAWPSPGTTREDVWAELTLDSIAGGALGAMGVVTRRDAGTDNVVACQLVGQDNGTTQRLRIFDTGNDMQVTDDAHAFAPGTRSVLRIYRDGGNYECSASDPTATNAGAAAFDPVDEEVGLRLRSASGRWHWVMVLTRP